MREVREATEITEASAAVGGAVDAAYLAASAAAEDYVRHQSLRILAELGAGALPPAPEQPIPGPQVLGPLAPERLAPDQPVPPNLGVVPELASALTWLLEEAAVLGIAAGAAAATPGSSSLVRGAARLDDTPLSASGAVPPGAAAYVAAVADPPGALEASRRRLLAHAALAGASLPLIDHVAAHYGAVLTGRRSGAALLLKPPGLRLWEEYFSAANPLYDVHNRLAAAGLAAAVRRLGRPARVLELGAGTGGATAAMAERLLEPGLAERVATLTLSDVSPSFLLATVERLAPLLVRGPWRVARRRLDFTRPWAEQGIPPASVDVIAATNALHNGGDLMAALRELRGALAPDGFLVLSESLCESGRHVHQELIFNLLPLAPAAPIAPLAPIAHGRAGTRSRFLTRIRWEALLAGAGFAAEVAANRRGPELALLAIARPAPGAGGGPARPDPLPAGEAA